MWIVEVGEEMKQSLRPFFSLRILEDFYHIYKLLDLFVFKFQLLKSNESHATFQNIKDNARKGSV